MICKYAEIFCWTNVSSCCSKATHIFSAKNIRILYIESAKTVNEMTLNELVKLTMLWTTVPWFITGYCDCNIPVFLAKAWPCLAPSGIWYTLQRCYGVKQYRCSEGTFIWFRSQKGWTNLTPACTTHTHACMLAHMHTLSQPNYLKTERFSHHSEKV